MQVSRLYSNRPDSFTPIDFHCGENSSCLNVIFAEIKHPKDNRKSSHNLGKTTLTHLLDFMLLKKVKTDDHFLTKHYEHFKSFVFFCEIALSSGKFVTIRRAVENNTKICVMKHDAAGCDFSQAEDSQWTHSNLSRETAVSLLDGLLALSAIKPWSYRHGVSYFLRTQTDYSDPFVLEKYKKGSDSVWKPFAARLFGIKDSIVTRKYELDAEIQEEERRKKDWKSELPSGEISIEQLKAQILILSERESQTSQKLDAFDFHQEDKRIAEELANETQKEISKANMSLYNLQSDISRTKRAIQDPLEFNLQEINRTFKEAEIFLPETLVKGYEDLVAFNKKLSSERNKSLRKRLEELKQEKQAEEENLKNLNAKLSKNLSTLASEDIFKKYKKLQTGLSDLRVQLTSLNQRKTKVEEVDKISERIEDLESERKQKRAEIKAECSRENNDAQKQISLTFSTYVKRLLNVDGYFYITQNKNGNLDFKIEVRLPDTEYASGQDKGNSYQKMICALFDLAVLKFYEDKSFCHFVYHDGILEGLDYRQRRVFLEIVREAISSKKIQYILSAKDDDLPRDESDRRVPFTDEEIILKLHDNGKDGLLFKMRF